MLYYFIFVMMPIRAAKQRRNGIAEPRSGRSDGEGERKQRRNEIAEPRSGRSDGEGERKHRRSESRRNEVTEREHGGATMSSAVATSTI